MKENERFDVAILGSGLGGTVLAAILGRHGHRVLLLERGTHPRFAVGEAMLPQSSMLLWILGERFGVPEIQHLSSCESIARHVSPACGVKRTIGFLYHREGERQRPSESHLLIPPVTPLTSESHLYRQEVDLYLLRAAIGYGAVYKERVDVVDFAAGEDGVRIATADGEEHHARFLVDGTGHNSVVARRLGLREQPTRSQTRSRSIFTHMTGVPRYDDTLAPGESPGLSAGWYEGTLHHVFDGGWFWIIPFDNHPGSENPLCSVGLTFDMTKVPDRGLTPQQELEEVLARYPSIAAHLGNARAVRDWVSTGRLQYSATSAAAPRTFLLAHAYGFIDALYSRGLISNLETIHALAPRLLEALAEDDFATERFAYPERLQAALLDANDRMVASSYRAFGSFELWNAWVRLWLASTLFGDLRLFRTCLKYLESRDPEVFAGLDEDPLPCSTAPGEDAIEDLLRLGEVLVAKAAAGQMDPAEAASEIFGAIAETPLPPIHGWASPRDRHLDFTPEKLARMIEWGKGEAPLPLRQRRFDFDPAVLGMAVGA